MSMIALSQGGSIRRFDATRQEPPVVSLAVRRRRSPVSTARAAGWVGEEQCCGVSVSEMLDADTSGPMAQVRITMVSDSNNVVQAGGLDRVLGSLCRPQTYRNVLFLLVRLPLGIAYFTTFFTGLVLGVVLTPLGVGIPFLGVVIGFSDYAGRLEATVTNRLLGTDLTYVPLHDPYEEPLVPYVKSTLTEPRSYLLVAYFLVSLAAGIGTFTLVLTAFTVGLVLLLAPAAAVNPGLDYTAPDPALTGGTIAIDTLPEGLVLSVVGLASLIVSVHVVNAIAAAHAKGTAAVLHTA
jgi:hypothetical protein